MIRTIKFSNFYSFKEEQEISFLAKKKKTNDYFTSKSKDQITKVAGFIGGNASGKTNIMRLFTFLSYFVCMGSKDNIIPQGEAPFKTFFNNNHPSKFFIEYEDDNSIYFYTLKIQKNAVKKEMLEIKDLKPYTQRTIVFDRENKSNIKLNDKYIKGFESEFIKNIRPDISLIAFLKTHYDIPIINSVYNYFANFKTNINEAGEINFIPHQIKTLNLYLEDPTLKKQVEEFISNFDLGLNSFDIEKIDNGRGFSISVEGIHEINKQEEKLSFNYESRGTQSLFFTLANIFTALKTNSIVIVDEIEAGLHPDALNKLLGYFTEKDKNKKAQLLFSSNSLGFLNRFDMHQIYLTEKNNCCESNLYRLSQVKGIRSDENFLSKYMSGAYGAFPKIRI